MCKYKKKYITVIKKYNLDLIHFLLMIYIYKFIKNKKNLKKITFNLFL